MKSEKGFTLIELLTTITILLLISSLVYSTLIGSKKNYNQITEKSNLEQEANVIIATIKNYHQTKDSYVLTYYPSTKKAAIGTTISPATIPLGRSDLDVTLKIGISDYTTNIDFTGNITVYTSKPINVYLKIANKEGQSYETNTIIKRY
jgi:prepilin-type N-terminal cleavage/methylation domain-containing protein